MRDEWRRVQLGELCTLTKGTTPTQKSVPGAYPLVVTAAEFLSSDTYQFEGAAVCVPMVSSTGHGHASLKRVHYASGRFAVANIITALQAKPGVDLNMKFLWLLLDHGRNEIIVPLMKGTANVSLSQKALAGAEILLPPLEEQKRVVDIMAAVDQTRAAAEELQTHMRRLHAVILESEAGRLAGDELPLEDVFEFILGGSWGSAPGVEEVDVVALGPSAYAGGATDVDSTLGSARSLSKKRAADRKLRRGDIILERSGGSPKQPVGRVLRMLSDQPNVVPSDFMRLLRVDSSVADPEFIFWLLWSHYHSGASLDYQKFTTGLRNLNIPNYLRSTRVMLPSRDAQRDFVDLAEKLAMTTTSTTSLAIRLQDLRANLLTALLSGQHEIPESYDELIEEAAA